MPQPKNKKNARTFRVVNPSTGTPGANPPRRSEPIPWRLILITGAVSSLGALVIGDLYRVMKSRIANVGSASPKPQPVAAAAPPYMGHLREPAANAYVPPGYVPAGYVPQQGHVSPGYDDGYEEEEEDESGDLWNREEIEDRVRRLNRKEKELNAREAEIADRARKLRLIS